MARTTRLTIGAEVVYALAGCVRWSLDLLAWLTDCLFDLMNDPEFRSRLVPERYPEMAAYLLDKNDVSLQLLLSSSSRGFLSAVCRRITHMEALSAKAIDFYRRQSASAEPQTTSKSKEQSLQQAYQEMQQVASSSLIKVAEFDKLLNTLFSDVRQAYQIALPNLVKHQPNPPQGKQMDTAIKSARTHCELSMVLSSSPPAAFLPVIKKFFDKDLPAFRKMTDPAELFFAKYDLLELQDDESTLAAQRTKTTYVDAFKRGQLKMSGSQQWRRCTRCTAVMEDVFGTRPGFTFVLRQQQRCFCGGYWGLMPKGKLL